MCRKKIVLEELSKVLEVKWLSGLILCWQQIFLGVLDKMWEVKGIGKLIVGGRLY